MAPSKLERYIEVLKAISVRGHVTGSKVADEAKISSKEAKQCLSLLINQGLVEHASGNSYSITRRGLAVLNHFGLLAQQPQTVESY